MPIYTVDIKSTSGSTVKTYTVNAATLDDAIEEANRRARIDPTLAYIRFNLDQTKAEEKTYSPAEVDLNRKARLQSSAIEAAQQRQGDYGTESEGGTGFIPRRFLDSPIQKDLQLSEDQSRFVDTYGIGVNTPTGVNAADQVATSSSAGAEDITYTPMGSSYFDAIGKIPPEILSSAEAIKLAAELQKKGIGADEIPYLLQDEVRKRLNNQQRDDALESASTFAAYLESLNRAGLNKYLDRAGPFAEYLKNQRYPIEALYDTSQLLPLATQVPFSVNRITPEETDAYIQALQTPADDLTVEQADLLNRARPSFTSFATEQLQKGGGIGASQRLLENLKAAAGANLNQANDFFRTILAPSTQQQAGNVINWAGQALGGKYSPIAVRSLMNYLPSAEELWGQYVQQTTPDLNATTVPTANQNDSFNFLKFVGDRFGLF